MLKSLIRLIKKKIEHKSKKIETRIDIIIKNNLYLIKKFIFNGISIVLNIYLKIVLIISTEIQLIIPDQIFYIITIKYT